MTQIEAKGPFISLEKSEVFRKTNYSTTGKSARALRTDKNNHSPKTPNIFSENSTYVPIPKKIRI